MDDVDPKAFDTLIRQRNLRMAFRNWPDLKPDEFEKLIAACKQEWSSRWLEAVMK